MNIKVKEGFIFNLRSPTPLSFIIIICIKNRAGAEGEIMGLASCRREQTLDCSLEQKNCQIKKYCIFCLNKHPNRNSSFMKVLTPVTMTNLTSHLVRLVTSVTWLERGLVSRGDGTSAGRLYSLTFLKIKIKLYHVLKCNIWTEIGRCYCLS